MKKLKVLIIGGTGTVGQRILERWSHLHQLTIVNRDSHRKSRFCALYPQANFVLADIEEIPNYGNLFVDQDLIIHAAAIKHVSVGQSDINELVRVNVNGTMAVARTFAKYATGIGIFLSSDKAVQPANAYGASKMLGESICLGHGMRVLRYGNVVGSSGSFIPLWWEAGRSGKPIVARDATRFFLTIDQAINLIQDCFEAENPGLYIPKNLKGFRVMNVARYIAGNNVIVENLQPGEKQHEQLLSVSECAVGETELLSRVVPGINPAPEFYFSNNVEQMLAKEVLEKVGWDDSRGSW